MNPNIETFGRYHESGSRGKPDSFDRQVAHRVSAYLVEQIPQGKFNVRVEGGYDRDARKLSVFFRGEMSTEYFDLPYRDAFVEILVDQYNKIHRMEQARTGMKPATRDDFVFNFSQLNDQSGRLDKNANERKWGDSGKARAVAIAAPGMQPYERFLAIDFRNLLDDIYRDPNGKIPEHLANAGVSSLPLLGDGKVSFDCVYRGASLQEIRKIVIARRYHSSIDDGEFRRSMGTLLDEYLRDFAHKTPDVLIGSPTIIINGAGPWTEKDRGFWYADAGTCDVKPQEEWWGEWGITDDGGSGEDRSKPSLSNNLIARHAGVQVIGNGLASLVNLTIDADMGRTGTDNGIDIETFGTRKKGVDKAEILHFLGTLIHKELIPATPYEAAKRYGMLSPEFFESVADASDYFHLPIEKAPWNAVIDRSLL